MAVDGMGFRFEPEWRTTLFVLIMVPVMVHLGFWQLDRAEEKSALAATWSSRQAQAPVPVESLWGEPGPAVAYLPVELQGQLRETEYLLLDNSIHNGQFGYQVLAVMELAGGQDVVLLNRGWIAGDPGRTRLPEIPPLPGPISVSGHIYVAPGEPYLLAEQQLTEAWPKLLQAVEMDKIAPVINAQRVFPFPVRIDPGEPGALETDWQVVNVSPEKHQGYAVQWFSMAAVLAVIYLLRSSNIWQLLSGRN